MSDVSQASIETVEDIGLSDRDVARRWLLEIKLAGKTEKSWRADATKIYKKYRGADAKKNSFNILWANTEILREAVYSAAPKPDVRRRFRDADPLGKAVSQVLDRAITFSIDSYGFDQCIKSDVLENLLVGRGLSRVRYIPSLVQVGDAGQTGLEENETDTAHEPMEGDQNEELEWEQALCEHVDWEDFRHGPGKSWGDLPWIAFRHQLKRDQLIKRFGEIGKTMEMSEPNDDEIQRLGKDKDTLADIFKTCEVWEIWDKDEKEVVFVAESYLKGVLKTIPDPLGLEHFFPVPRPLYAVEDTESLIPTPIYNLYKEQAEELDRVSMRINKIVEAMKIRGIYDATIGELSELFKGADNELIPASAVAALQALGGLDKAIWFAPVELMAAALRELYTARNETKQVIYELTGISDIIRGSTDANETAAAQGLKSQWGTLRLRRMQADVQRYCCELIRMIGEIVGEKFQIETLRKMTGLPYPTAAEAQLQVVQYQQAVQMAQQQGQQPPPQPPAPITWEQIKDVLSNDASRSYKIDIETDSTIAQELREDAQGLQEVLAAVGAVMEQIGPLVVQGVIPFEAAKEIIMTICRRARLGSAVEDALDQMKPPPPPQDPEAGKIQAQMQLEQMKAQLQDQQKKAELASEQQHAQLMAQIELQKEQQTQALQHQQIAAQNEMEAQRMQLEQQNNAALEQIRIASDERAAQMQSEVQLLITQLNNAAKIEVAEIAADTTLQGAQISAAKQSQAE